MKIFGSSYAYQNHSCHILYNSAKQPHKPTYTLTFFPDVGIFSDDIDENLNDIDVNLRDIDVILDDIDVILKNLNVKSKINGFIHVTYAI